VRVESDAVVLRYRSCSSDSRGWKTIEQRVPIRLTARNGVLADAHFSFSYTPVRSQEGTVAGLFGTCIETTAAIVNSRLLAKSEERLQIALSAGNSVGTWDWDVPSDRVFADARFAKLYGAELAKAGARSRSSSEASIRRTSIGFRSRLPRGWRLANRSGRSTACHSRTGRTGG
jgi:PAS domain-containing protein